jgi:Ca2+-binding RTX toxin-like protein
VDGGAVTGGVMNGYDVLAGTNLLVRGSGYDTDGAALFKAIVDFQSGTDWSSLSKLTEDLPLKVVGSNRNDLGLTGSAWDDVLLGKRGSDFLYGAQGDDIIEGGRGRDYINGAEGSDTLWGGRGEDAFILAEMDPLAPPTTVDRIKDFTPGEDVITLLFRMFDPPAAGPLGKQYFHKGPEADTAEQRVLYDKKSGHVMVDFDGSGSGAAYVVAKVDPGTKLGASDFYAGFLVGGY